MYDRARRELSWYMEAGQAVQGGHHTRCRGEGRVKGGGRVGRAHCPILWYQVRNVNIMLKAAI